MGLTSLPWSRSRHLFMVAAVSSSLLGPAASHAQQAGSEDGTEQESDAPAPPDDTDSSGQADASSGSTSSGPTREEIEAAREAYQRGKEAFQAEDYAAAADAYQEAYDMVPDATLLFEMGDALQRAEEYRGAGQAYERYIELRPDGDRVSEAESRLESIRQVPGTVSVTSTPAGATVTVDGESQTRTTPLELSLAPGSHTLRITKSGYIGVEGELEVQYAASQEVDVTLEPSEADEGEEAAAAAAAAPAKAEEPSGYRPSPLVWTGLSLTAAGLLTGTVLGAFAMDQQEKFDQSPGEAELDDGEAFALGADVAFGVGIAAGITTLVLWVTERKQSEAAASSGDGGAAGDGSDAGGSGGGSPGQDGSTSVQVVPALGRRGGGVMMDVSF